MALGALKRQKMLNVNSVRYLIDDLTKEDTIILNMFLLPNIQQFYCLIRFYRAYV